MNFETEDQQQDRLFILTGRFMISLFFYVPQFSELSPLAFHGALRTPGARPSYVCSTKSVQLCNQLIREPQAHFQLSKQHTNVCLLQHPLERSLISLCRAVCIPNTIHR